MALSPFITAYEIFAQLNGWHIGIVWFAEFGEYDWVKKYSLYFLVSVKKQESKKHTLLFYTSGFV